MKKDKPLGAGEHKAWSQDPEFRRVVDVLAQEFAEQAMAARIRTGKTQAQLAESMGVTQPTVAKIEAGSIKNIDSLQRYARAVGCRVRLELVPIS